MLKVGFWVSLESGNQGVTQVPNIRVVDRNQKLTFGQIILSITCLAFLPIHKISFSSTSIFLLETQTMEQCGQQVKLILKSSCLPQWHRCLLQHLIRHFYKMCWNTNKNPFTPRVLGEAFSEVLLRPSLPRWDSWTMIFLKKKMWVLIGVLFLLLCEQPAKPEFLEKSDLIPVW